MEPAIIPTNYTNAGKILGLFEIRSIIETLCMLIPLALFVFSFAALSLTTTVIVFCILLVPVGGFGLMGIQGYSLFEFIMLYVRWRRSRRIIIYHGMEVKI